MSKAGKTATTRRVAMSVLAASMAAASATPAAAACVAALADDPIFSAIAAHRHANEQFVKTLRSEPLTRGPEHAEYLAREEKISAIEHKAYEALLAMEPATLSGLLALVSYVDQQKDGAEEFLNRYLDGFDGRIAGDTLIATIVRVLSRFAA